MHEVHGSGCAHLVGEPADPLEDEAPDLPVPDTGDPPAAADHRGYCLVWVGPEVLFLLKG